jgi:hypothetical protein
MSIQCVYQRWQSACGVPHCLGLCSLVRVDAPACRWIEKMDSRGVDVESQMRGSFDAP